MSASGRRRKLRRVVQLNGVTAARAERFATVLRDEGWAVDRPPDALGLSELDSDGKLVASGTHPGQYRALRDRLGSEYIATLAESRVGWPAWAGADPQRDEPERLFWSGYIGATWIEGDRSLVLPLWFALPLVRRVMRDEQLRKQFENSIRPDKLGLSVSDA